MYVLILILMGLYVFNYGYSIELFYLFYDCKCRGSLNPLSILLWLTPRLFPKIPHDFPNTIRDFGILKVIAS